jgi:threonine dehydrogenase-like Zn-dependent dehydrogenase
MRALQLEDFNRLVVVELPDPVAGPGEVVIATIATGICGSDIHGYTGHNGRRHAGQVMGHETVGRIHSVGAELDPDAYPLGALVTVNPVMVPPASRERFVGREQHAPDRSVFGVNPSIVSAFAERFTLPAANVVRLPDGMPIEYGALIEPLAVGLNAVRRVAVREGERVLVIGGGPIGQSTVLAALHEGAAEVFVSEPNASRRELCGRLGATALDPAAGSLADQLEAAHGGLVDVAIDAVGISETLADALGATVYGGRVCLVGMGSPELLVSAYRISTEERSVVGSFTYSFEVFDDCARWVAEGDPRFASLISTEVPIEEADGMFQRLANVGDVPGKALVRLGA